MTIQELNVTVSSYESLIELTFKAIAFISGCITIYLAYKAFRDLHEYNRRKYAMELVEKWDSITLNSRKYIWDLWPDIEDHENPKSIKWQLIDSKRNEQRRSGESKTEKSVIEHLNTIVNFLELIAVAINHKTADEPLLRDVYHGSLKYWLKVTKEYRKYIADEFGYDPWAPLTHLENTWYPKTLPITPNPTG